MVRKTVQFVHSQCEVSGIQRGELNEVMSDNEKARQHRLYFGLQVEMVHHHLFFLVVSFILGYIVKNRMSIIQ